jgi:hypothetical protein
MCLSRQQCPLWVISRHFALQSAMSLYPRKRTSTDIPSVSILPNESLGFQRRALIANCAPSRRTPFPFARVRRSHLPRVPRRRMHG